MVALLRWPNSGLIPELDVCPRIALQRTNVVTADTHPCPPTNWHPCFTCHHPASLQVIPRWEGHNGARPTRLLRPIPQQSERLRRQPPSKIPTDGPNHVGD